MVESSDYEQEIEFLRGEITRLEKERDSYKEGATLKSACLTGLIDEARREERSAIITFIESRNP